MIEFIKHITGACGEHWHPNVWTFMVSGVGIITGFNYIKYKLKGFKQNNKNKQ
jgi:hypothetical protein